MGPLLTGEPRWACHRILPSAGSQAMKLPEGSPLKSSLPAVLRDPEPADRGWEIVRPADLAGLIVDGLENRVRVRVEPFPP